MDQLNDALAAVLNEDKGGLSGLEETARLILSTATSDSSSVTVNYLIPLLLFAIPVLYFVFRLGLFNLDDALGMTSGLDLSGYNAPAAGYGAPAQTYNAPAPSYNAPAPSYNAPAPAPSYNSPSSSPGVLNGAGISSGVLSSGAYLSSKDDDALNLEYLSQINNELQQLRQIRDLLQGVASQGQLQRDQLLVQHPSPRLGVDVTDTWNGLPGL